MWSSAGSRRSRAVSSSMRPSASASERTGTLAGIGALAGARGTTASTGTSAENRVGGDLGQELSNVGRFRRERLRLSRESHRCRRVAAERQLHACTLHQTYCRTDVASLAGNVGQASISKRRTCQISAGGPVLRFEGTRLGGRFCMARHIGDFAHRRRRVSELLRERLRPVDATVGEIEPFLLPQLNRLFKQRNGACDAACPEKCVAEAGEGKRLVGHPPQGALMELRRLSDESIMIPTVSRVPGDAIALAIGRRSELQEVDVGEGVLDLPGGEARVDPRPAGTRRLRRPGERLIEEREAPPRFVGAVGRRLKQRSGERCKRLGFRRVDVGRLRPCAVARFEGDVPLQGAEEPPTEACRALV
ncbi:hypothetical protein OUZ56_032322 [Daphnia magna]|uniref:Uncharacterized protein n=1 Tax=Daphnia magna TaxID=35525 RepID=A0ABR0B8I9_9CRUS|nr:hypothetical protein OUZ56_032322 [Daphnia magna]